MYGLYGFLLKMYGFLYGFVQKSFGHPESHFTFFYRYCFQNLLKKEEDKEKKKEKDAGSLMSSDYGYAECYPGLMEMEDAIGNLPPSLPFPYLTIPSFNPPYLPFQ